MAHYPIQIMNSNGHTPCDGLGGAISNLRVQSLQPIIIADEINALEILHVDRFYMPDTDQPGILPNTFQIAYDATEEEYTLSVDGNDGTPVSVAVGAVGYAEVVYGAVRVWMGFRVLRTPIGGALSFACTHVWNNNIAADDYPSSAGEVTQYRCVWLVCRDAGGIVIDAIAGGNCEVGFEAKATSTQIVANGTTAPVTVVFGAGASPGVALADGEALPIWIKTVSADDEPIQGTGLIVEYTHDSATKYVLASGFRRRANPALEGYCLYKNAGIENATGTLVEFSATLPFSYTLAPPVSGSETHRFRVTYRNQYGVESMNALLDLPMTINAAGEDESGPNPVTSLALTGLYGASVQVDFSYGPQDGFTQAELFIVTATDGSSIIENTITRSIRNDGLVAQSLVVGPFIWGETVTVDVWAQDAQGRLSAVASASVIVDTDTGQAPWRITAAKSAHSSEITQVGLFASQTFDGVVVSSAPGAAALGDVFSFALNEFDDWQILYNMRLVNGAVSGAASAPVEKMGDIIYLSVDGVRVAALDTDAGTLTADRFSDTLFHCPVNSLIHETTNATYFQVVDLRTNQMRTWLAVDAAGCVYFPLSIQQEDSP